MALTKMGVVNMLYEHIGIPKVECAQLVESVFDIIKDELGKGNPIKISGFGKWTVKSKRARKGRNPLTGKVVIIAARKVVTFKASPNLRDVLNSED